MDRTEPAHLEGDQKRSANMSRDNFWKISKPALPWIATPAIKSFHLRLLPLVKAGFAFLVLPSISRATPGSAEKFWALKLRLRGTSF